MIVVFGSINMDLVARVGSIARPGETVLARRADTFFGGKGANQAVAAARMAGGPVAMVGAVGDDAFGKACLDNLVQNKVDTSAITVAEEPTGCAFIAVDESGENAITVAGGANACVQANSLPDALLKAGGVLVLQMEVPLQECLAAASRARAAGMVVIWNVAPAPSETDPASIVQLLQSTHVLVVNEHEAVAVAEAIGLTVNDYREAGTCLARAHGLTCIVTAGAEGAFAFLPDGAMTQAPSKPIVPVDTTGAGDTFVGVLASGLAEGRPLPDSMRRATLAASLACLSAGAQAGMPTADILE